MVSNKIYDYKIDVWAIGVIIYEMVAGINISDYPKAIYINHKHFSYFIS